jgi:hypothetical protein
LIKSVFNNKPERKGEGAAGPVDPAAEQPSGTEMGDAVVTVYEIVPANTQKYVRVLVNEFLEINTYRLSPSLQRMISSI